MKFIVIVLSMNRNDLAVSIRAYRHSAPATGPTSFAHIFQKYGAQQQTLATDMSGTCKMLIDALRRNVNRRSQKYSFSDCNYGQLGGCERSLKCIF